MQLNAWFQDFYTLLQNKDLTDFLPLSGKFVVIASINTTWQILRAWLPKILQEGRGYSESQTLHFTSAWYLVTDVGCLGAGALAVTTAR